MLEICNNKVDRFNIGGGETIAKKSKKSKNKKLSKSQKMSKFQKLANSKKKLSKNGNLANFDIKKNGSNFLTPKANAVFNHLRQVFIEPPTF